MKAGSDVAESLPSPTTGQGCRRDMGYGSTSGVRERCDGHGRKTKGGSHDQTLSNQFQTSSSQNHPCS